MAPRIDLKRVYDPADAREGTRVLVDGLWPRGVPKSAARIDDWPREIAPSRDLRRWFAHDPARWESFYAAYREELAGKPEALRHLLRLCEQGPVTLVFAARDRAHNHAVVLREVLLQEWTAWHGANAPDSPVCYGSDDREPGT